MTVNVIETARLNLRRLVLEDADFILRLLNEPEFLRFIGDKGVRTLDDARHYLTRGPLESYRRHRFGLYRVGLRRDDIPIGICGLVKRDALEHADVGYAFLASHGSLGYATESAAAVLDYGRRTLGLERIVAIVAPGNLASIAVLERIGLKFERRVRLTDADPEVSLFG